MNLQERYTKEIAPALKKSLELSNVNAVPTITKVTLAVGIAPAKHKDGKIIETAENVLSRITGQKAVKTLAKKSISNFKTRKGQVVGIMVTVRGKRMWDFVEKLIHFTFPRVRDFRGIPTKVIDEKGNFSYGFNEYLSFPEMRSDEVERVHGLQVTISSTAGNREHGMKLFESLGIPFQK